MSKKRRRRRRIVLVLAVLVATVVAARWWVAPWAVKYGLESFFEERLRGQATIGDVDLAILAGHVWVRDFEYRDPNHRPILSVESARFRFTLEDLLDGFELPERVELDGVHLRLEITPEGTNLEDNLKPDTEWSPAEDADTDDAGARRPLPSLVLRDTMVDLTAPAWLQRGVRLRIEAELLPSALVADGAQVKLNISGDPDPSRPESRITPISLLGQFDARTTHFRLATDSRGVRISRALRDLVTPPIAEGGFDWLNPTGSVLLEVTGSLREKDGLPDLRLALRNAGGLAIKIREFPYALEEVQGVTYVSPGAPGRTGAIELDDLLGTHGRAIARVRGDIFGFLEADADPWLHLLVEGREIPLDEDLEHALNAVEPEFGAIWSAIQPQGTADFQCLLYKTPSDPRVKASIVANVRDGVFEYAGFRHGSSAVRTSFPYRLEEVSGTVSSHLEHSTFHLIGRGSGGSRLTLRGVSRNPDECGDQPVLEVWIHGQSVPLDDKLRTALRDMKGEEIWRQLSPSGRADMRIHISQPRFGSDVRYELVVLLKGKAAFQHELLPIPLLGVEGIVRMQSGWRLPRLENVRGRIATGRFRANGTLSELSEDRMEIKFDGPFLGKDFAGALLRSPRDSLREAGQHMKEFGPVGNGAATVVLRGLKTVRSVVQFEFLGAYANGPALPFGLASLTGSLSYDGSHLRYENIVGWHGGGWVEISGEQRLTEPKPFVDIRLEAQNLDVGTARPPDVGPLTRVRPILRDLRPLGVIGKLEFQYDSRAPKRYPSIVISARDLSLRPARTFSDRRPIAMGSLAPIRLRRGLIFYNPSEGLKFHRVDATVGAARFGELEGRFPPTARGETSVLNVTTRVANLGLDSDLFRYLSSSLPEILGTIRSTGTLHTDSVSIETRIHPQGESEVRFTAPSTIRLDDFSAKLGPELSDVDGKIRIEAGSTLGSSGACRLRGQLQGVGFRLFGMHVANAEGAVIVGRAEDASAAEESPLFLRIDALGGDFYEGRLGPDCNFDVLMADPYPFRGYLNAQGVRVQQLVADFSGSSPKDAGINGILDTRFRFQADRAGVDALVAVGEAKVSEGRFGSVPAFVTLFNYFNNHFHQLESTHIEVVDRKIFLGSTGHIPEGSPVLESLPGDRKSPWFRLSGDALDLMGAGHINFGGEMEFQFEPRDIWLSTPIPGISHVLDLLLRQTGTVYVLGTVERIDVQPILFGLGGPERGKKQPVRIPDGPLWPAKRW